MTPLLVKPNDLASQENFVKVLTQSRATVEDMLDYIKSVVRENFDAVVIHTSTNDQRCKSYE